ncbi:MAG: hypothetical protein ACRDRT_04730, partial [Pseudonocardiaceae bacterium]
MFEIGDEYRVGVLEKFASDEIHIGKEAPVRPDRIDDGKVMRSTRGEILGTERRGLVHQACA